MVNKITITNKNSVLKSNFSGSKMFMKSCVFALAIAVITAAPERGPELKPIDLTQVTGEELDKVHVVDQLNEDPAPRFNPDVQNVLHLFTARNPTVSQPFLFGQSSVLLASNFDASRRTAIIIHGWTQSATSDVNTVLVPAFLRGGDDMNVIIYDWSVGASILQGDNGPENAVASGFSLARAIDWISRETGASPDQFHLVGFSLGAHLAGVAGRNIQSGRISYITALDPGANMEDSGHILSPDAATYTEAIHTNADIMGHGSPLAHVDFYPNGGDYQPGCGINFLCNHMRSIHFFAETITTPDNWRGVRCQTVIQARLGLCISILTVRMGGLTPKAGTEGIYHLSTNPEPPFQPLREE